MDAAADCSSSSSSSISHSPQASPAHHQGQHDDEHHHRLLPPKRRAGRKKFRETRHPVYRGVRARAGGTRWVCEVREPQAQARIWLGTYPTPEMAARAHDVAAIALRGATAAAAAGLLNFPDSADTLPRARTAAPEDIRCAAAQAAERYRPASSVPSSSSSSSTAAASTCSLMRLLHDRRTITTTPLLILSLPEEAAQEPAMGTSGGDGAGGGGGVETTTAYHSHSHSHSVSFLDEDAIFDMPGLMDDMARGMLLTPPSMAMGRGRLQYWGDLIDDSEQYRTHIDMDMDTDLDLDCTLSLWVD